MIEAVVFDEDGVEARTVDESEDLRAAKSAPGTTWVRAADATEAQLERVATAFGLHSLALEDLRNDVRPKVEEFEDHVFLLVKDAELRRGDQAFAEEVDDQAVGLFLGEDWLVTLSTDPVPAVDRVWSRVQAADARVLQRGPDFTAYRIVDLIVDEYFELLDEIETGIEAIEDAVIESTDIETLEGINATRRDLLAFRKLAWPTREAMNTIVRGDVEYVDPETEKYYRDVYDQLIQVVDLVETYRDLTSGARDIYLNTLSQSTNEVMKTLTVVATIFIPLTFVAGIYGMNFVGGPGAPLNMPELEWEYGYPAVLALMALIAVAMLGYFRRKGWV